MDRARSWGWVVLIGCLSLAAASAAADETESYGDDGEYEFEDDRDARLRATALLGVDYSQGDYGSATTSRSGALQAGAKLEYEPFTLRASVPLLVNDGVIPDDAVGGSNGTEIGLGDVLVSAAYTWYPQSRILPVLDFITKVKIPTASENDGLGTGKTDVTLQLELSRTVGVVSVFAGGGYRFKGGGAFRDVALATAGASARVSKGVSLGAAYEYREASTNAVSDSHEISPFVSVRLGDHTKLIPYGLVGLSNGAPDWGVGSTISYEF